MRCHTSLFFLVLLGIFALPSEIKGQQYLLNGQLDNRFIPNYHQQIQNDYFNSPQTGGFQQTAPTGFQPLDSYFPQRDLQTSDLPAHLQHSLPQYRYTTESPLKPQQRPYVYQNINLGNAPPPPPQFRPQHSVNDFRQNNIIPSTHRPNYSHLFGRSRDPETETFLGEITIQNPEDTPPHSFKLKPLEYVQKPIKNRFLTASTQEKHNNDNSITSGSGRDFLNHRTRILAPETSDEEYRKPKVNNYFVNKNGDVYQTTRNVIRSTTSRPQIRNPIKEDSRNSINLEPLLEEPIRGAKTDKDDVEIVKSKELNSSESGHLDGEPEYEEEYEYDEEHDHPQHEDNKNNIHLEEDEDHEGEEVEEEEVKPTSLEKSNYEVVTMKTPYSKTQNFTDFVDTGAIDTSVEPLGEEIPRNKLNNEISNHSSEEAKEPIVVSVVTTKSVINNTVVAPENAIVATTEKTEMQNTTDSWVVVASVQTSRSVSGARYLPSSIVSQEERFKVLNEATSEEENKTASMEQIDEATTEAESEEEEEEITTTISPSTTIKFKTSTESLTDKLDRVQSDLSSGLLTGGFKNDGNNIAVLTDDANMTDKMNVTRMLDTTQVPTTTKKPRPAVSIKKFSPYARPTVPTPREKLQAKKSATLSPMDIPQGDQPIVGDIKVKNITVPDVSHFLPAGYKIKDNRETLTTKLVEDILRKVPTTRKTTTTTTTTESSTESSTESASVPTKLKSLVFQEADIADLLPPDYKPTEESTSAESTPKSPKSTESSKESTTDAPKNKTLEVILAKAKPVDISSLLPPGFKLSSTTQKPKTSIASLLKEAKPMDIAAFLPPGYKPPKESTTKKLEDLFKESKTDDVSALLPPGYKGWSSKTTSPKTTSSKTTSVVPGLSTEKVPTSLLPPGYKLRPGQAKSATSTTTEEVTTVSSTTSAPSGTTKSFKIVFPSRPGGIKKSAHRLTTPKTTFDGGDEEIVQRVTSPTIHKGWPIRVTTEFTGWPTPSTTPISIEKLLEAARAAATSKTSETETTPETSTTTTTTTSTTTQKPTTPGKCQGECDLAGTIKLISGAKWVPELLDRNTKEWQILANEVETQLEDVYSKSNLLKSWYKAIKVDGFSEGSVLVDYVVELNDIGKAVDTSEIKKLFHESLEDPLEKSKSREAKALNETAKLEGKLKLGDFVVDPMYTDFIVLPKQLYPTVGYAEDNMFLPQWAIAVIVIGLASLLFVIIFGVTVLVNRQKNSKKKIPTPLTEDMLNELNKNHMGGLDNYAADDLYGMEDVWDDRGYETKIPKKRSNGSINDNSMAHLYDSWKSEWNGHYYNGYYGNPGSSYSGYGNGRRRSDYDTNF